MKFLAAICVLGLVLATSAAPATRNRKLKESALEILWYAEEKGGLVLSEILLGKRLENGMTVHDPIAIEDLRNLLNDLLIKVKDFKALVLEENSSPTDTELTLAPKDKADKQLSRRRRALHAPSEVVLPRGSILQYLDYNDILDITGDYTKAFVDMVLPNPLTFMDREVFISEFNNLVDHIVDNIKEIAAL